MYLGIEIGGTKLQLALGLADGKLIPHSLIRSVVDPQKGREGICRQIENSLPLLCQNAGIKMEQIKAIGIGYGGPTNDHTQTVIKSHHIQGWDSFPLSEWLTHLTQRPTVICNDADVAGLGEAMFGAGRVLSPVFYMTIGSGIGGGLIINGKIYRGIGYGASEIGHVRPALNLSPAFSTDLSTQKNAEILEYYASGWGIGERASELIGRKISGSEVAEGALKGDPILQQVFQNATDALAEGICTVIKLLCPKRIILGGGVSLSDAKIFLEPIKQNVAKREMKALAGLTEIVVAELGEEVVLHGAFEIAKRFANNEQYTM